MTTLRWFDELAWFLVGVSGGVAYFAALRGAVQQLLRRRSWPSALALSLGRVAAAVVVFWLAARSGVGCMLAAFGGFLLARALVVRRARAVR